MRFSTLDGLRGVAAIAVVLFHLRDRARLSGLVPHAYLAVDFFFVLSGFVVSQAYGEKLAQGMSAGRFMAIRMVRLYPLLFLGVVLGAINQLAHEFGKGGMHVSAPIFILGIIYALFAAPMYVPWVPAWGLYSMNLPSWSLLYEAIANWVFGVLGAKLKTLVLLAIIVGSLVVLAVFARLMNGVNAFNPSSQQYTIPVGLARVGFSFFLGVLLREHLHRIESTKLRLGLLPCSVLMIALFEVPIFDKGNGYYDIAFVAIASPFLVIFGANRISAQGIEAIEKWLGKLSYPLYITHLPIVLIVFAAVQLTHLSNSVPSLLVALAALGSAIVFALMAELWDDRFRRWISAKTGRLSAAPKGTTLR